MAELLGALLEAIIHILAAIIEQREHKHPAIPLLPERFITLNARVRQRDKLFRLLSLGERTRAIHLFRTETASTYAEARSAVTQIDTERLETIVSRLNSRNQLELLLREHHKLQAIKLVRLETGVGLRDGKAAVEYIERSLRSITSTQFGVAAPDLSPIYQLLQTGKKIQAIKLYRQQTGVGLKEAKEAIETIQAGGIPNQEERRMVDPDELQRLVSSGRKIEAIKYFRASTGSSLKEAKEAVEFLQENMQKV